MDGEIAVVSRDELVATDYHLSPSRWASARADVAVVDIPKTVGELAALCGQISEADAKLFSLLAPLTRIGTN